jgi:hypothetical protein
MRRATAYVWMHTSTARYSDGSEKREAGDALRKAARCYLVDGAAGVQDDISHFSLAAH